MLSLVEHEKSFIILDPGQKPRRQVLYLPGSLYFPTVKPVFRDHIKQYIFLAFQTGGCLLMYESTAESSYLSFLH